MTVILSYDDRYLFSGCTDQSIKIWDLEEKGVELMSLPNNCPIRTVAISTHKQIIISGGLDGTIKIWGNIKA